MISGIISTNFKINFIHISGLRSEPTMHVHAIQMFVQGFGQTLHVDC